MFHRQLTEEEIQASILAGHKAAHDFMKSNPTWDEMSDRIDRLRFAASHAVENFNPNKYILRGNRNRSESTMRKMLLGAFRKTQELREIESLREKGSNIRAFFRASYLDYETQLPLAVTTFKSNGTVFEPDYKIPKLINTYSHLNAVQ